MWLLPIPITLENVFLLENKMTKFLTLFFIILSFNLFSETKSENIQILENNVCPNNEVAKRDNQTFKTICIPVFSINYLEKLDELNHMKGELQESCKGKRKLDIETKYVNDFRVDTISMDFDNFNEYCDENKIIISLNQYSLSKYNSLILEKSNIIHDYYVGAGADYIPRFLDGQNFVSKNYVWFRLCPGNALCQNEGFYMKDNQIKKITINDFGECKFIEESILECITLTDRAEFDTSKLSCSRANFVYDTYRLHYDGGQISKKELVSQHPIPEECQKN